VVVSRPWRLLIVVTPAINRQRRMLSFASVDGGNIAASLASTRYQSSRLRLVTPMLCPGEGDIG